MGLFRKKQKFSFHPIPSAPEQTKARSYLVDLMGQDVQYPTMGVADLTDTEQGIQERLPSYLDTLEGDHAAARGYFEDVLAGGYDPRTSDFYQGFRDEQDFMKDRAMKNIRLGSQRAGMGRSTPSVGVQGLVGQQYDSQTLQMLGQLTENERSRMAGAAGALPALSAQEIGSMTAAQNLAAVQREQEQMKLAAMYESAINTLLAPYNLNANIAMALLNEQRYTGVQSGGGLTGLGFAVSAASSMFSFSNK